MATSRITGITDKDNQFFKTDGEELYHLLGQRGFSTVPGEKVKIVLSGVTADQRDKILSVFQSFKIELESDEMEPRPRKKKVRMAFDGRTD